jgi:predicted nucleic acid-binding Zn ribbon protein
MPVYEDDDQDDAVGRPPGRRSDSFDEDPDARDIAGDDDVKCVHCGRYIDADADICPHCRTWQTAEGSRSRKPRLFVITALVCVAVIVLFWIFKGRILY